MSEPHDENRWRELADLLGLPPDENKSAAAPRPVPSFPAAEQQKNTPPPLPPDLPEAEPFTEKAFEPAGAEEVVMKETVGPGPDVDEEASQDRRGRGRRRGRRGQRNDPSDRNNRASPEPAAKMEETLGSDQAEEEPGASTEQERGGDRGRGGRGRRHQPADADRREFLEDEPLETEVSDQTEHVPEEEDDEEIDKLTDWSVPSWTELIGSLYRPER